MTLKNSNPEARNSKGNAWAKWHITFIQLNTAWMIEFVSNWVTINKLDLTNMCRSQDNSLETSTLRLHLHTSNDCLLNVQQIKDAYNMAPDPTLLLKHSWLSSYYLKFSESLSQQQQDCPLISWPCHLLCSQSCSRVYPSIYGGRSRHFHICIQILTREGKTVH